MSLTRALVRLFTRRFSRRPLRKRNVAYFVWRFVGNGARTYRKVTTPRSHDGSHAIATELRKHGISVGPSDTFLTRSGLAALEEARDEVLAISQSERVQALVGAGASSTGKKDFVVDLIKFPHGVPADSPLLKVALDEKLLEIVSSYLGLWPCLYSTAAWLNFSVDAPAAASQLWHRDPEDLQIIKVFIYLVDVNEQCGPFTYIPRTHPFGTRNDRAQTIGRQRRVAEERMDRVFPPTSWRVCTGPAKTMILADTLGYHRGGKPTAGQRVLITFTYTSGTPILDPPIHVADTPTWISATIQQAAVKPLLAGAGLPGPSRALAAP